MATSFENTQTFLVDTRPLSACVLLRHGFLRFLRKLTFVIDGKPCPDQEWYEFFAQLNGTILSLWDAEAVDQAAYVGGQTVLPQFINVTDAAVTAVSPQEIPDHQHVLSISTAGSNRYFFQFQNQNVVKRWSAAFRIAIYERNALQECYTAALIARSRAAPNVKRLFSAYHGVLGSKGKYSGWVRTRFSWSTKWQKCWIVVSDTPSSWFAGAGNGLHERILHKFSNKQSLRGEARFYESRRDAKNKPIAILGNVYAAYAVYPEKPFLVDSSTLIKVEGSLHTGRGMKDVFVLLMPDDIRSSSNSNASSPNSSPVTSSGTPAFPASTSRNRISSSPSFFPNFHLAPKETASAAFESMLTWLVAFYDAFNLYGRPDKLITDAGQVDSLIFAMPTSLDDAYLDVEDVFVTLAQDGHLEDATYSSREWRNKLKELTLATRRQGKKVFNPAILLKNAVAEVPMIKEPVPPHIREKPHGAVRSELRPAVRFPASQDPLETTTKRPNHPAPNPATLAPPQGRRRGLLRRKGSRPERAADGSVIEDRVGNTHVAMTRFSLNDDSGDEPEFHPVPTPYTSTLQNNPVRPMSSDSGDRSGPHMRRPLLTHRTSSHRRAQSETRMGQIYREAEETTRGYASDDENDGRHQTRRVSSDETLKMKPPMRAYLGPESRAWVLPSRSSLENGTRFNNRFDPAIQRLSGSSSDQFEIRADPLRDTPHMGLGNAGSSPASSMESLPPVTFKNSPSRAPRRSVEDTAYNSRPAPPDTTFSALSHRAHLQSSELGSVQDQPIPFRRDGSPPRHGPRTAPWKDVLVGVSDYDQHLRATVPTPPSSSSGQHRPPVVNYPVHPTAPRPQQFDDTHYPAGIKDLQIRARGPVPSAPYDQPPRSDGRKIHRKNVPSSSSSGPSPPSNVGNAAARSAYQQPTTPPRSGSLSPSKSRYPPPGSRPLTSQRT